MANNRIDELLTGRNKRDFAKDYGIPEQTLYKICKKPTMKNISIDVFLKIAKGLGMTAEELYYGEKQERTYADEREGELHRIWNDLDEERRGRLIGDARDMEVAKSNENHSVQTEEIAK